MYSPTLILFHLLDLLSLKICFGGIFILFFPTFQCRALTVSEALLFPNYLGCYLLQIYFDHHDYCEQNSVPSSLIFLCLNLLVTLQNYPNKLFYFLHSSFELETGALNKVYLTWLFLVMFNGKPISLYLQPITNFTKNT